MGKISIGDYVSDKRIYNGNEFFLVIGIRPGFIEIEGDFSGGTHAVRDSCWVSLTDDISLIESSGWCDSWYTDLPVIGQWYEIGVDTNTGFKHLGIRQFMQVTDALYGFFDDNMRQIFPKWYKKVELSGFAKHHRFKKAIKTITK